MTRRTIELPDTFHLHFDYRVVYSDINASSHLAADRIMPITIEAQFRFIKSLGYSDATVFEDAGLIMVHSETQYLSESHHDDVLSVAMAIDSLEGKQMEFAFAIKNKAMGKEVARLRSTLLFFDYEAKKVIEAPERFKENLNRVYGTAF
jgi:acyl-CoA thioesterase FadM